MVAWFSSEISIVVSFELINLISSFFILAGASQSLSAQTIFPAIFHPKVIIFQCHDNVYNMIITLYYRINGEDRVFDFNISITNSQNGATWYVFIIMICLGFACYLTCDNIGACNITEAAE